MEGSRDGLAQGALSLPTFSFERTYTNVRSPADQPYVSSRRFPTSSTDHTHFSPCRPEQLTAVSQLYLTRLAVPHLDIAQTFSSYSSFITKYDNDNYGEALPAANKIYAPAVKKTDERFAEEAKLVRLFRLPSFLSSY
jgi:hypothetical protein